MLHKLNEANAASDSSARSRALTLSYSSEVCQKLLIAANNVLGFIERFTSAPPEALRESKCYQQLAVSIGHLHNSMRVYQRLIQLLNRIIRVSKVKHATSLCFPIPSALTHTHTHMYPSTLNSSKLSTRDLNYLKS